MADQEYDERIAMTVPDAAALLGMHPTAFKTHVLPKLRVIPLSRKLILVPRRELERWVEKNATQG